MDSCVKNLCQLQARIPILARFCPECGSTSLYKDGLRYLANGSSVQRWLCRKCGYRFSQTNRNRSGKFQHVHKVQRQILNSPDALPFNCQGIHEAKSREPTGQHRLVQTLAEVENPSKSGLAGATQQTEKHLATDTTSTSKIIEYAWKLKKQGYAETTIEGHVKILKRLVRLGADLCNPESVKEAIAKNNCSEARKELMVEAYSSFLAFLGGKWEPPRYRRVEKLPFIPTEREIDDLIAGCSHTKKLAAYLQLLKETGMRSGEACKLKWTDIDFVNGTVSITPEKGSSPRILKISNKLIAMLNALQKDSTNIFPSVTIMRKSFARQRNRLAKKLQNPRLKQIKFHTFRHWKATLEYAKTKDILHVMKLLGHKNIKNTLMYTQLVNFKDDDFVCKAATTSQEAKQFIESGFEYVCTAPDGVMLFRKRK
ncbi:MAG: tyrosine-type recombinase/integrase [Candidatus Bathyarchaeota archaeon]|nr:tyrosine-type recombinase/integrase [Candidatus Bathyarchaeota archaeon]